MMTAVVVAVIALALVLALILLHNAMVRGRNLAEEAWSGINVQLRRRHDLVPLLISAVQGYARHEKDVLDAVAGAREQGMKVSGGSAHDVGEAEKGLSLALGRLMAVAEAYPETFCIFSAPLPSWKTIFRWPGAITTAPCASRTTASCSSPAISWPGVSALNPWNISSFPAKKRRKRPGAIPDSLQGKRRCIRSAG